MINIPIRLEDETAPWFKALQQFACELRVCCPGIIQSFDSTEQTVTVKLALREEILQNKGTDGQTPIFVRLPMEPFELLHVPIVLPRAGGYVLTVPIQQGDECLLIWSDMCIDSWLTSGDVQNQKQLRRHHIADAFAILAPWSKPNCDMLVDYSLDSMELRSLDGTVKVEIRGNEVHVMAPMIYAEGILNNSNGASGTFTTPTGQTVTVQNGIVTQIV